MRINPTIPARHSPRFGSTAPSSGKNPQPFPKGTLLATWLAATGLFVAHQTMTSPAPKPPSFSDTVDTFSHELEIIKSPQTGPETDYKALSHLLDEHLPKWFILHGAKKHGSYKDGGEMILEALSQTQVSPEQKVTLIVKFTTTQDVSAHEFSRLNDLVNQDRTMPVETADKLRRFLSLAESYRNVYQQDQRKDAAQKTMPAAEMEAYHRLREELASPAP